MINCFIKRARTKFKYVFRLKRCVSKLVTKNIHFDSLKYLQQECNVGPNSKLVRCMNDVKL